MKTPWGQNDVAQDGERVDEHAQPGTGSTDVFGSLAFLYLIDQESALFVSSGYRDTGKQRLRLPLREQLHGQRGLRAQARRAGSTAWWS